MFTKTFSVTREQGQCNFLNGESNIPPGASLTFIVTVLQHYCFLQLCSLINYVASALISVPENSLHQHHGILLMSVEKKTAKEIISHPERSSRLPISRYCTDAFQHHERTKGRQTEERKRWKEQMKQADTCLE